MQELTEIQRKVKRKLDKERYEHTLGVMYTAAALAMRYEADVEDALLAGLLHDCAKCIPDEKKYQLCEKYKIALTESEQNNSSLIHAKLGEYLAYKKYQIANTDVLHAIRYHTTGREEMSLLEKIVYIADYIEPGRCHAPNLSYIRAAAFQNIDTAMHLILESTLHYLKSQGGIIDPMTEAAWNYYKHCFEK